MTSKSKTKLKITFEQDRKCRRGHPILPSDGKCLECNSPLFDKRRWSEMRIGFLDIETNNFSATFGYAYGYFIKVKGENKFYSSYVNKGNLDYIREKFEKGTLQANDKVDKRMLMDFIRDVANFDVLVTYNGDYFDIPYLRTRCLANGLPFPLYGDKYHWDIFKVARAKLKFGKYPSMEKVAELLGISGKNHVDMAIWQIAQMGSEKAFDYIKDHNKRDVIVLEQAYDRLEGYWKKSKRSI